MRWIKKRREFGCGDSRIQPFLDDIEAVFRKHDLSIAHEDNHGAFLIEAFSIDNLEWLKGADDNVTPPETP